MKKILEQIRSWLPSLYRLLMRWATPFSKIMGSAHIAPHQRGIKARDVMRLEDVVLMGDVILTFSEGELSNLFIEGDWKHCAMYVGAGEVVEAIGRGVVVTDIDDFCASKDRICVLRASFCTVDETMKAVKYALSCKGKPYDFQFEPNEQALYCAELVWWAYAQATKGLSPFERRQILGVDTVLPSDFYNAKNKFIIIEELPLKRV